MHPTVQLFTSNIEPTLFALETSNFSFPSCQVDVGFFVVLAVRIIYPPQCVIVASGVYALSSAQETKKGADVQRKHFSF